MVKLRRILRVVHAEPANGVHGIDVIRAVAKVTSAGNANMTIQNWPYKPDAMQFSHSAVNAIRHVKIQMKVWTERMNDF